MTIDPTLAIDFSGQDQVVANLATRRLDSIDNRRGEFIANALFVTVVLRYKDPDLYGVHLTLAQSTPGYPKAINLTIGLFNLADYYDFANRLLVPAGINAHVYQLAKTPPLVRAFVVSQQVPAEWKPVMAAPEISERVCIYSKHDRKELEAIAASSLARDKSGRLVRS